MVFGVRDLLGSARLSAAVPNPAGTLALLTASKYDFDEHQSSKSCYIVDLEILNGKVSKLWTDKDITETVWLGSGNLIAYLKTNGTKSELWIAEATLDNSIKSAQRVYTFPGAVSNLKIRAGENFNFVVSAPAFKDGSIYSEDTAPKKHSTGRVYTSLFVRHWDEWISEYKSNLFSGTIAQTVTGDFKVGTDVRNLIHGTDLETPIAPFGGAGDFDISPDGKHVIFLSKDPKRDLAQNTASYVYAVPFDASAKPKAINPHHGASSSPRFSSDGTKVVYLQMHENGYEADKNEIFITEFNADYEFVITQVAKSWDRSPSSVIWSANDNYLYLIAEEFGREKVFHLPVVSTSPDSNSDLDPTSSLTSPNFYMFVPATKGIATPLLSPLMTLNGVDTIPDEPGTWHGLSRSQVSDFFYPGTDDYKVHAWMIKPSFFDKSKKYPLLFFIHGGPQGAWIDGWSYRWNPAVMAEQGYIVVALNPTGSTGYMINWIAGQPLGKKFKALVCHDGIFNTINMYATEELWFIDHDFNGQIFEHRQHFERWNPVGHVKNWTTPMMIIHSSKDYRIPISEALAAFNVLQIKGIKSKFLTFPDENHWVLKPENSLVWHKEVLEWMAEFTGLKVNIGEVESGKPAESAPEMVGGHIELGKQDVMDK
ncbi:hypothetical protein ABW21_db0203707 [Orbilia brochopaga]|nr:hypothetical protein ABW21_db0203707 [Drechslerella brochopaga]